MAPLDSLRQPPDLTEDLLEEIFLRISSPADLTRASTSCVSFRRLITDPTFLRQYRSLHPPLLLGFLDSWSPFVFQPAEAPHPNAPAARALATAADFSFNYLPPARWFSWSVYDVLDGLVLLSCKDHCGESVLPELVVCDPLSRRYLLLPPMPDDQVKGLNLTYWDVFLTPSADEDDEASYSVTTVVYCPTKSVVFVFNSGSDSWRVVTPSGWDILGLSGPEYPLLFCHCYAYGCFFWKARSANKLVRLDKNMEFSAIDLPPAHDEHCNVVVEAGEGRLGLFCHIEDSTFLDYYTSMQSETQKTIEWQMKSKIPLPVHDLCIVRAPQGYIFLLSDPRVRETVQTTCFSLEIKTLKIEKVSQMKFKSSYAFPYFGFPPSMSSRRI
ncbi:hypothetical protein ACP70R_005643 [Stipagrostis hirtigluma subsp. patula]